MIRQVFLLVMSDPGRVIELLSWKVVLAIVGYRERVHNRLFAMDLNAFGPYTWRWRWLRDLVDRVSPFDPWTGYRRKAIRRVLWPLTHPVWTLRRRSLRISYTILDRVLPYIGPGKFGSNSAQNAIKAEWLLDHDEWAEATTGDAIDWFRHVSLFTSIRVPWSLEPEHWLMTLDSHGFVYVQQYDTARTAKTAFDEEDAEYERTMQPFDEDVYDYRDAVDHGEFDDTEGVRA